MSLTGKILITGGSGLIGTRLTEMLLGKGYEVSHLSRQKNSDGKVKIINWDLDNKSIAFNCDEEFDVVIHLAGASLSSKRWTENRKKEILRSRIASAGLLSDKLRLLPSIPGKYISSSAVGYYGSVTSDHIFKESDPPGNDFLSECCVQWEKSADQFAGLNMKTAIIRTGVVLSDKGGMLEKVVPAVKYYAGASLGNGRQYLPWIHLDDLCRMYINCIENDLTGVYNGVAPNPVTYNELMKVLARQLNKPLWLPNIPSWVLKMALGEMSTIALKGSRVSAEKMRQTGFEFQHETLETALWSLDL